MSAAPFEVPRADLVAALVARAREGPPLLVTGPPGAGKTTLLLRTAAALSRAGLLPVYLDLMGAVSSPDRFVAAALGALPADAFAERLKEAVAIRRLAAAGRAQSLPAVEALLALLSSADEAGGRPVVLLLDEATEIRSLAYFPGLRQAEQLLAAALAGRARGTLLATSFPTLARRWWTFETLALPPLGTAELEPLLSRAAARGAWPAGSPGLSSGREAQALLRLTSGWPRSVRVMVESLAVSDAAHARGGSSPVDPLVETWAREMALGGRLEAACRHTYESLLLRSRGYGMSKAVLQAVAREEGLNLTALVARLGRTPGAVRDYLQWLVGVDAIHRVRKRYRFVDGLLGHWVRLHATGTPPDEAALLGAARQALETVSEDEVKPARRRRARARETEGAGGAAPVPPEAATVPVAETAEEEREIPQEPAFRRNRDRDLLIEID